jgi:hypothetical protein
MTTPSSSQEIIDLVSDDEKRTRKRSTTPTLELQDGPKRRNRRMEYDVVTTLPSNITQKDESTSSSTASRTKRCTGNRDCQALDVNVVVLEAGDSAVISYGILELLNDGTFTNARTCLSTSNSGPQSSIQHVQQTDRWSCGFRNMQMMLSAVIPHLPSSHALFQKIPRRIPNHSIPSLLQLQQFMEGAWRDGFDPTGARHYGWKMTGQRRWIGAVEVAKLLCYLGVDATVVQFVRGRQSREMLPKFVRAHFEKLNGCEGCPFCPQSVRSKYCAQGTLQWSSMMNVLDPTPQQEPECSCPILPLYLQWKGHSITIVGIEADGTFLVYDPLKRGDQILSRTTTTTTSSCATTATTNVTSSSSFGGWNPIRLLKTKELVNDDTQIILCTLYSMTSEDRRRCIDAPDGTFLTAG